MIDRNKYLTEAMGELAVDVKCLPCDGGCQGMGGCHSAKSFRGMLYTDFSTADGFFKLKEYITTTDHRHEFWGFYIDVLYNHGDTVSDTMDVINPDSLANNYYEFLKGREV